MICNILKLGHYNVTILMEIIMKKNLIIYHGSNKIVKKPKYGYGNTNNDYGLGFYCTEDVNLAKEWAVSDEFNGFANKYELNTSDLKCLDLSKYNVLFWITILLQNRVFNLKNDITKIGKKYLIDNFSLPYEDYDIIKGYRADDSHFAFAEAFLNNSISCQRLSEALRLGNLGEQIVIKSEKAFNRLEFIGYDEAKRNIYYPLRKERNEKARIEFLSNKAGNYNRDAIYLSDILKGDIKEDDPRLQ